MAAGRVCPDCGGGPVVLADADDGYELDPVPEGFEEGDPFWVCLACGWTEWEPDRAVALRARQDQFRADLDMLAERVDPPELRLDDLPVTRDGAGS
jgi:hypothetical protein